MNENPNPVVYEESEVPKELDDEHLQGLREYIYDIIRSIQDPEHPHTLEELRVVQEGHVYVKHENNRDSVVVWFTPTVPHCSLATMIGLCIRHKIESIAEDIKVDVVVKPGSHNTDAQITKQLNDKERVAAALDNPTLRDTVERLIKPPLDQQ
mmetsp:Transcript_34995/g.68729  ORF Transcript_34995/g.68729 Transcript_34995/m.68729 type:complete len:153 (+) Transcript_34995:56-514(+)